MYICACECRGERGTAVAAVVCKALETSSKKQKREENRIVVLISVYVCISPQLVRPFTCYFQFPSSLGEGGWAFLIVHLFVIVCLHFESLSSVEFTFQLVLCSQPALKGAVLA